MALLGGTGLSSHDGAIPPELVLRKISRPGTTGAYDEVWISHASEGYSVLQFRSYDQGREKFQGMRVDVIWCDEEPPMSVYLECLQRTMAFWNKKPWRMLMTFTTLLGMSEVVTSFLDTSGPAAANRKVIMATWDDVPHLSKDEKERLWASLPPGDREALSNGIPQLGSGAIYPLPVSSIAIDDFSIPYS